jgi:hypothetical protein
VRSRRSGATRPTDVVVTTPDPSLAGAHTVALRRLADAYRPRPVTPLVPWRYPHRLVKPYVITARGASWDDLMVATVRDFATRQLEFDEAMGAVGLAVVVLHHGADGTCLVVQSWAKEYHSRLSMFSGIDVDDLRPAPTGAAPCIWELEVLSHERASYVTHILNSDVDVDAWLDDALDTRPQPRPDGVPSGT